MRKINDHNPNFCDTTEYYIAQEAPFFGSRIFIDRGKVPLVPDPDIQVLPDVPYAQCDPAYCIPNKWVKESEASGHWCGFELSDKEIPDEDPRTSSEYVEALGGLLGPDEQHMRIANGKQSSTIALANVRTENGQVQKYIAVSSTYAHFKDSLDYEFFACPDFNLEDFIKRLAASGACHYDENWNRISYESAGVPHYDYQKDYPLPMVVIMDAGDSTGLVYKKTNGKIGNMSRGLKHYPFPRSIAINNYVMFEVSCLK